jgi:nucleoside-diphosphate-sugar epimerase
MVRANDQDLSMGARSVAEIEVARVAITGGAGLVGQNFVPRLKSMGSGNILVIDKAAANTAILKLSHPDIDIVIADLSVDEGWQECLAGVETRVHAHAQISGLVSAHFVRNPVCSKIALQF